jgi:hypothetical protein
MMSAHDYTKGFFFLKFNIRWMRCRVNYFFQQKLVIIILEPQLRDCKWEISKGLGLEIDAKIRNVQQNISLVMVFNG